MAPTTLIAPVRLVWGVLGCMPCAACRAGEAALSAQRCGAWCVRLLQHDCLRPPPPHPERRLAACLPAAPRIIKIEIENLTPRGSATSGKITVRCMSCNLLVKV
jgi:hypothetical protein